MATFLLAHNPNRWHWDDLQDCIKQIESAGWVHIRWSCGKTKQIHKGDRIYLIRLGKEPKGIVASGWAISDWSEGPHWDESKKAEGKTTLYVDVLLNALLDPDKEDILPRKNLDNGILKQVHWSTQSPGILIPNEIAKELDQIWYQLLKQKNKHKNFFTKPNFDQINEEIEEPQKYSEGAGKKIDVTVYERNIYARRKCVEHYGFDCNICGFSFEQAYGIFGKDYIHVHHIKPIAEIGREYEIDPIEDLRPVCPNCHAMIHSLKPPLSLSRVKEMFKNKP